MWLAWVFTIASAMQASRVTSLLLARPHGQRGKSPRRATPAAS